MGLPEEQLLPEERVLILGRPEMRLEQFDRDGTLHHAVAGRPLRFCAEADLPPAAVRTGTLVAFVEWCWHQPARPPKPGSPPGKLTAPTTIDRRLSGIVVTARRRLKLQLQEDIAEEARALLKAKKKAMAKTKETRGRGPAPALLVRHMEKIAAALPENRSGIRDLSMMTMHFAIAGREHELAWLRVRDIVEDPEGRGLIVDVRVSKVSSRVVEVLYGSRAHICPVRAWRRWKEAAALDDAPDGFAFRRLHNRWGTVLQGGLDPETVGDVLTRIGARAELDIRPTGHESARAGNADAVIERQGGWARGSKVMRGYREADDGFKENALHGVL
ncbi:integrase [Streptomyces sp. DSM 116496]|uniref:integrase n=1 Tax=Streptomyces stoeckheimensis TaxID=3344656 RepID=UPI0038B3B1A4